MKVDVQMLSFRSRGWWRIVDAMGEGAMVLSADGLLLYGNPALSGMLGLPQEHLAGLSLRGFMEEPDTGRLLSLLSSSPRQARLRVRFLCFEDCRFPVELAIGPFGGSARRTFFAVAHEDREAEDEESIASMFHDLRSPLRHIGTYAGFLSERLEELPSSMNHHDLGVIARSVSEMDTMVRALVAYHRLGEPETVPQRVDLEALVREVFALFETGTEERSVAWTLGPLPEVMGDPVQLRAVFSTLVSLAVQLTPVSTLARIAVEVESGPSNEKYVVLAVRGHGEGFDALTRDRMPDPFHRLRRENGTGGPDLGLAAALRIVRRQGGRVWAGREPDRGATFFVALPRAMEEGGAST